MRINHLEPLVSMALGQGYFLCFFGHDTEEGCVNACVWDSWVGDSMCSPYIPGPTECLDTCVPGINQTSRLRDLTRCVQGSVPRTAACHGERQGPALVLDDNLLSILWGRKSSYWKIEVSPPEVHMNKN